MPHNIKLVASDHQHWLVSSLPDLAQMDSMRDTRIICSDGTLSWNSILLSQMSETIRMFMVEFNNTVAMDPLMLIIPDMTVATMIKLLTWSTKGIAMINSDEKESIINIFHAMKVPPEMFCLTRFGRQTRDLKRLVKYEPSPSTSSEIKRRKIQQGPSIDNNTHKVDILKAEPETTENIEVLKHKSLVKDDNDSNSSDDEVSNQKWICPKCCAEASNRKGLVTHLLWSHYGPDLLKFWGKRNYSEPCLFCNKYLFHKAENFPQRIDKIHEICRHIGKHHGKVKELVSSIKELEIIFGNSGIKCPLCSGRYSGLYCLRLHLANFHYQDQLLAQATRINKECQTCFKRVADRHWPYHIAMSHHLLMKLLPEKCLKVVFPGKVKSKGESAEYPVTHHSAPVTHRHQKSKSLSSSKPAKAANCYQGNKGTTSSNMLVPVGGSATMLYSAAALALAHPDRKRCNVCSEFVPKELFTSHLAGVHFKKELLELSHSVSSDECGICGQIVSFGKTASLSEVKLAEHVGIDHNLLERVLPEPTVKIEVVEEDPLSGL